jgi:hypothetical protein
MAIMNCGITACFMTQVVERKRLTVSARSSPVVHGTEIKLPLLRGVAGQKADGIGPGGSGSRLAY